MFSLELINQPSAFSVDLSRIREIFWHLSIIPLAQNGILNIAFLSDEEIRVLNHDHRWIDSTTDVLSFHYFEDFSELGSDEVAGEIILSESRILSQAMEHGHSPERELEILVIHSILHILGYDHETDEEYEEMWKWEEGLREKLDNI